MDTGKIMEYAQAAVAIIIVIGLVVLACLKVNYDGLDTGLAVVIAFYFGRTSTNITNTAAITPSPATPAVVQKPTDTNPPVA